MKLFLVAVLAFAIGLAAGLRFAARQAVEQLRLQLASGAMQQRTLALVSLHTLDELQDGHVDLAKSFLAKQVALYYHTVQQLDSSHEKQELLRHIEASSSRSPELNNALSKKSQ